MVYRDIFLQLKSTVTKLIHTKKKNSSMSPRYKYLWIQGVKFHVSLVSEIPTKSFKDMEILSKHGVSKTL